MGSYLDEDEFNRWITNASSTLKSALNDGESGFYNWACFKAQQASEFSIKAYLRGTGNDSFGYSISMLLQKGNFDTAIINKAKKNWINTTFLPGIQIRGRTERQRTTIQRKMLLMP